MKETLIVGAGIGGLTLALELGRRGMPCRIFESAPEIRPLGVGINLLPHATQVLGELGLEPALAQRYQRLAGYDHETLQGGHPR